MKVLALCTGNSARSVMAGVMLRAAGIEVVTAGTHVVEGQPMSRRTREALAALGFEDRSHRSRQVTASELETADLVLAMAGEHVGYVRRELPGAAARTATLKRLCRDLSPGPPALAERVAALGLAQVVLEPWEDVDDPAGGDEEAYLVCAKTLADLCSELCARLR